MPYLHGLQQQHAWGALVEPVAFQTRPAFFAGLWPDQSDVCHLFWRDPVGSPYRFLRRLPLPEAVSRIPRLRGALARLIQGRARREEAARGHSASAAYARPWQVPYRLLPWFGYPEARRTDEPGALPRPTVFDGLRSRGMSWLWLAYPGVDQRIEPLLAAYRHQLRPEHRLVYLHFAELDWIGHRDGPASAAYTAMLGRMDDAIRIVIEDLRGRFDAVNGIVFGDHGMVRVDRLVDVWGPIMAAGLRVPEDVLVFLDSTQARFWFHRPSARATVEAILKRLPGGHVLTAGEARDWHLDFAHDRYGELIFVTEPRVAVFPNFFQRRTPPAGMHGYTPEVVANWAHFVLVDDSPARGPVKGQLVDVYPTLARLLGLHEPTGVEATPLQLAAEL
jgi:hypothetical protein